MRALSLMFLDLQGCDLEYVERVFRASIAATSSGKCCTCHSLVFCVLMHAQEESIIIDACTSFFNTQAELRISPYSRNTKQRFKKFLKRCYNYPNAGNTEAVEPYNDVLHMSGVSSLINSHQDRKRFTLTA